MRRRVLGSLVGRVALASALAAALGGSVAALSTGITAKELVAKHEKKNLKAAARELSDEVREELYGDDDDEPDERLERLERLAAEPGGPRRLLEQLLAHELEDVKLPGAVAVIRDGERVLAGEPGLPHPARGDCDLTVYQGRSVRACTVGLGGDTLTLVVSADAERDRSELISSALLVGLLSSALLGGAFSYFVSRWALSPLTSLRDRVRALPIDDPEAARLGGVADQLEIEELRSAIASLVERLGNALKQAQSFAAEAAHELRTPLTTISGELELIAEATGPVDRAALGRVRRQVADLTELVQRLLVLAQPRRVDAQSAELVDLSDVLRAAEETFAPGERSRVRARVADDVIVRGDAALLRTLLVNALDNALKFSDGEVEVSIRGQHGQARIDVIDSGPGIAGAEREHVFRPFYRSPTTRAGGTSGHGIGLSLIARVAWLHNGQVELVERERGTHLCLRLPTWNASTLESRTRG